MSAALHDLTGKRFGRLIAVGLAARKYRNGRVTWKCRCMCGRIAYVTTSNLKRGGVKSCGCLQIEMSRTHGATGTPEYRSWHNMKTRCADLDDKDYGGRGIKVCRRWLHSFENFLADMGPRPPGDISIDRKKNHLGYSPGNCRWATRKQQNNNQRPRRPKSLVNVRDAAHA